uniref:Uncharacterized protein n=1 Tax=Rhizophora mucronata TaxID=61149 RepID=A0A2P2QDY4_RHIMU
MQSPSSIQFMIPLSESLCLKFDTFS